MVPFAMLACIYFKHKASQRQFFITYGLAMARDRLLRKSQENQDTKVAPTYFA